MKISKKILGLFMLLFATVLLASCGEADLAPTLAGVESHSMAVVSLFKNLSQTIIDNTSYALAA
jgi:hypothetical protein